MIFYKDIGFVKKKNTNSVSRPYIFMHNAKLKVVTRKPATFPFSGRWARGQIQGGTWGFTSGITSNTINPYYFM